jgi:RNA polymerase sigma-70 factor (ECF subfamily)
MATAAPVPRDTRTTRAEALAEGLYATHRTRLLAIARRNSASIEDAEEALQDAFILFIDHFDPANGSPPLAWLTLTLKRRCWALTRTQRNRQLIQVSPHSRTSAPDADSNGPADTRPQPDEIAETKAKLSDLKAGLHALKPSERRALALLALGYSYREICNTTGWTYTKVNRCIYEGRKALQQHH